MGQPTSGEFAFLFTDIEGSTTLWERFPQAMQVALGQHDGVLRSCIEAQQGYVFKTIGDAFCAVFASPADCLAAALQVQRALLAQEWPETGSLRVRMGLHSGTAEARDGDYFGPALNRVARVLALGHGGQILLSQAIKLQLADRLPAAVELRDLGERRLKGLALPERIFQVLAPDLPADFPPLKAPDVRPLNLPTSSTLFVGRERELAALCALLRQEHVRLVTLVGPGGTGKTRLSQQVASQLIDDFPDGVFFVPLATLTNPAMVGPAIAQILMVKERTGQSLIEQLEQYLHGKHLLLILDNFEQIIAAGPLIAQLLSAAADFKVLITSREGLRVSGERTFAVPPMDVPLIGKLPALDQLAQFDAIRLFIERAQLAKPDWTMTAENAPILVEICTRLDGLPLAIELAAARVRLLSLQAMLQRLDNRLKLLTSGSRDLPGRQQTLRSTIDWSYDLLTPAEQSFFADLGVFIGGWTLELAQTVCATRNPDQVEEMLGSLVDKSLVRLITGHDGEPRFLMLATIHEYAHERLASSGQINQLRTGHALALLALAEHAEGELQGADQIRWFDRLEAEHDNLRAALTWLLEQSDSTLALRLTGTLWLFWFNHSHFSEGRRWLTAALARAPAPSRLRARALMGAGVLARSQDEYPQARLLFEDAQAMFQTLADEQGIAHTLRHLGLLELYAGHYQAATDLIMQSLEIFRRLNLPAGMGLLLINRSLIALYQGDDAAAVRYAEEGLELIRNLGDIRTVAIALWNMSVALANLGEFERAMPALQQSLELFRELGDTKSVGGLLADLGYIILGRGEDAQATQYFAEGLALCQQVDNKENIAYCLEGLAHVGVREGRAVYATRLFGAAQALRELIQNPLSLPMQMIYDQSLAHLQTLLSPEDYAAAWQAGQVLPLREAIAQALQTT